MKSGGFLFFAFFTSAWTCLRDFFVFVVVCLAVFTALGPLHRGTLADVRGQFVRDFVLQDGRSG